MASRVDLTFWSSLLWFLSTTKQYCLRNSCVPSPTVSGDESEILNHTYPGEGVGSFWQDFPGASGGREPTCSGGDAGSIPGLGRSPGEGNGSPLQYSGLENSMDYIVHGVAKSRTRLSNLHFYFQWYPQLSGEQPAPSHSFSVAQNQVSRWVGLKPLPLCPPPHHLLLNLFFLVNPWCFPWVPQTEPLVLNLL